MPLHPPETQAHVTVLGLGYVGCVTAACLAKLGHKVAGVDRDPHKVQKVLAGQAPFYEPGLEEIVKETVAAGLLTASDDLAKSIHDCDIAMICVGTPSEPNGNMSLAQLRRSCEEIASYLARRSKPLIVVIRSTVFPGTCEDTVLPAFNHHPLVSVVSNPEFLREGTAVRDFLDPSLLVVGGTDLQAAKRVAQLYDSLDAEPRVVSLRAAEMIKYACNCFHAVKISFANEIGTACARLGIGAHEVMQTLCSDVRLNISPAYLKPGFAFGGSCLPKDLRALTYRAARLDLSLPMLQNVLASNDAHMKRAIDAVLSIKAARIGIFGLAFKEDTDDLRESPVVTLVEHLIGKGRDLCIFDPQIRLEQIYGKNRQFALDAVPHIGRLMAPTLDEMLASADHIVVTQRPAKQFQEKLAASGKPLLDLSDVSSVASAFNNESLVSDAQVANRRQETDSVLSALAKRLAEGQVPNPAVLAK
jgi:GDP-mannose 6-dehydrogenase